MTTPTQSRSQQVNAEITDLLRSRASALWISSREERRLELALLNCLLQPTPSDPAPMRIRRWDCVDGLKENVLVEENGIKRLVSKQFNFDPSSGKLVAPNESAVQQGFQLPTSDPLTILRVIREVPEKCLYVLRDINAFKDPITLRSLRNTIALLDTISTTQQRAIVILTPSSEIPQDLSGQVKPIEYPLPDRLDIEKIFDVVINANKENMIAKGLPLPDASVREAAIDAALGLSADEMQSCFSRSLVCLKKIDPGTVAAEKKRVIARDKLLTWLENEPLGMSAVGGLECVKEWLDERKNAFSPEAKAFGLPTPKGIILAGIPGTGKSLIPKCLATGWGVPLLKLDLGALQSKWVGDSQANIRKALSVITSVGRCVVLLDEFEKALAGSDSSGGDGGVAADQLGTLLNFFQERDCLAFFCATLNDPRKMPPELLRKGRFDEFFWVDLPTRKERAEILKASLIKFSRSSEGLDIDAILEKTNRWTDAEIAALIPDALFRAFNDGARKLSTEDLLTAAKNVVPLSETMADKLEEIRKFMKDKARPASKPEEFIAMTQKSDGPILNLDG